MDNTEDRIEARRSHAEDRAEERRSVTMRAALWRIAADASLQLTVTSMRPWEIRFTVGTEADGSSSSFTMALRGMDDAERLVIEAGLFRKRPRRFAVASIAKIGAYLHEAMLEAATATKARRARQEARQSYQARRTDEAEALGLTYDSTNDRMGDGGAITVTGPTDAAHVVRVTLDAHDPRLAALLSAIKAVLR